MKIAFMTTENKGGPYYICKDFCDYLSKNKNYEVKLFNAKMDYMKLHFARYDLIISVIPFLFKPLGAKKYFYYLHGNYKIERKNPGLGTKLLYFSELNLFFSDKILLTSYFLADKLGFGHKYGDKISILSNYVKHVEKNEGSDKNKFKFLTISSFAFYEKGRGIINLGNVIQKVSKYYKNEHIVFTIIGDTKTVCFDRIKQKFDQIKFGGNIEIIRKGFVEKECIYKEYMAHNNFLYRTYLDNIPGVVLEALNYGLNVYTNDYESFPYFWIKNICVQMKM